MSRADPGADVEETAAAEQFAAAWQQADAVPGWLTRDQGHLLWDEARRLPTGCVVVEIGSHQGRSTLVLGEAVRRLDGMVVAIDPFVEGRMFGGAPTRLRFEANVHDASLDLVVRLEAHASSAVRAGWDRPIDLLYIDGKHDYWTVTDDLRWIAHCRPDGVVLIHDAFSSVGVTLALLRDSFGRGHVRYQGRVGSLARFLPGSPSWADRRRMWGELGWWLRNVAVKITLRLRLGPLTRALGHHSDVDPY